MLCSCVKYTLWLEKMVWIWVVPVHPSFYQSVCYMWVIFYLTVYSLTSIVFPSRVFNVESQENMLSRVFQIDR